MMVEMAKTGKLTVRMSDKDWEVDHAADRVISGGFNVDFTGLDRGLAVMLGRELSVAAFRAEEAQRLRDAAYGTERETILDSLPTEDGGDSKLLHRIYDDLKVRFATEGDGR